MNLGRGPFLQNLFQKFSDLVTPVAVAHGNKVRFGSVDQGLNVLFGLLRVTHPDGGRLDYSSTTVDDRCFGAVLEPRVKGQNVLLCAKGTQPFA